MPNQALYRIALAIDSELTDALVEHYGPEKASEARYQKKSTHPEHIMRLCSLKEYADSAWSEYYRWSRS